MQGCTHVPHLLSLLQRPRTLLSSTVTQEEQLWLQPRAISGLNAWRQSCISGQAAVQLHRHLPAQRWELRAPWGCGDVSRSTSR